MKLLIRVAVQSQLTSNGQMIQREQVHQEFDLSDDETLTGAFMDISVQDADGVHWLALIQK